MRNWDGSDGSDGSDGMTLIAIDGPAGAGKTTLAEKLFRDFSKNNTVSVIHMDDLYAGWHDPFSEDLSARLTNILESYRLHEEFTIAIFNWATMSFNSMRAISPNDILIIEGVGAAQKVVRDAGAITYWLDIEPSIGLTRVLKRDGFQIEEQMKQWQLDQDRYFARDLTRINAKHIITS